jgi:hypothetical protein
MQEAQIEQAKAEKIGKNTLDFYRFKDMSVSAKTRIPHALQGALRELGFPGAFINDVTLEIHTAIALAFHNIWIERCKIYGEWKKSRLMTPPNNRSPGLRAVAIICSPSLFKPETLVIPDHSRESPKGAAQGKP